MSQRDLAERVGVDFTYLSKIENGRVEPHSEAVLKNVSRELAEALAGAGVIKGRPVSFSEIPSPGVSAFPKGDSDTLRASGGVDCAPPATRWDRESGVPCPSLPRSLTAPASASPNTLKRDASAPAVGARKYERGRDPRQGEEIMTPTPGSKQALAPTTLADARAYRYGVWSQSRGYPYDEGYCVAGRRQGWGPHPCHSGGIPSSPAMATMCHQRAW